jgi:hypothetical protein
MVWCAPFTGVNASVFPRFSFGANAMTVFKLGLQFLSAAFLACSMLGVAVPASAEDLPVPLNRIFVKYRATKAVTEGNASQLAGELAKSAGVAVLGYERRADALILSVRKPEGEAALKGVAERIARANPDVEYAEAESLVQAN